MSGVVTSLVAALLCAAVVAVVGRTGGTEEDVGLGSGSCTTRVVTTGAGELDEAGLSFEEEGISSDEDGRVLGADEEEEVAGTGIATTEVDTAAAALLLLDSSGEGLLRP